MEAQLSPLLPLYRRARAADSPFALAVVVHTSGSTYRKPGALMAIAADGTYAGLLSGGCLEGDLCEHARAVIATGKPHTVTYNTGGSDDALWGLGVGCEGAMQILLLRVGPAEDWQPVAHLERALSQHERTAVAIAVESRSPEIAAGRVLLPGTDSPEEAAALIARVAQSTRPTWLESSTVRLFALPLALPPRLLLLGGGPDAAPIVDLAARLMWKVTVFDHRPAYAQAEHFPAAERVALGRPQELARVLDLSAYEAAVVMSHHLPSDLEYLRTLAASPIGYAGLLGPPHRREKLLGDLGGAAEALRGRLHAPVGLDLGGRTPESIALSIVAEIHLHLHQPALRSRAEPSAHRTDDA
ncbi:MAG TPA: XdhC family protein [Steroidobacteraceae bacterium]|nr:XdhC family protein [Steroidobacteraceae bacterium]